MEFNNCNSNACCTKLIAFNTKIPLFDLSHILHTLTFIDFFWNSHHFQKPEENLRSVRVRLGITQKSVVMIEGWCACPDGLAGSFCLVFNNLPRCVSSCGGGSGCNSASEPLWSGARQAPWDRPVPLAVTEEQPVSCCHLSMPPGTLARLCDLKQWCD